MAGLSVLVMLCGLATSFGLVLPSSMRGIASVPLHRRTVAPLAEVVDVASVDEFEKALKSAGDSLVVIDYSTSWCGPCKIIAPKFDEFSEQYKNVAFLKARRATVNQEWAL